MHKTPGLGAVSRTLLLVMLLLSPAAGADSVLPGTDYWMTPVGTGSSQGHSSFFNLSLPAGFFGPTSRAWSGSLWLVGEFNFEAPCDPDPYGADVITVRTEEAVLGIGATATIPITVNRIRWIEQYWITVSYTDGPNQVWFVRVKLMPGTWPGDMTIRQTGLTGGTFDIRMYPRLRFDFGSGLTYDYPVVCPLAAENIPWNYRLPVPGSCTSNFKVSHNDPIYFHGLSNDWVGQAAVVEDHVPQIPHLYSFGSGTLNEPADVAVCNRPGKPGLVFVADSGLHRVVRYSGVGKAGTLPFVFPYPFDDSPGPTGVAVNDISGHCNEGQVYVTDGARFLYAFDKNGLLLKQLGLDEGGENGFGQTWGVAIDRQGDVYVADRSPAPHGRTIRFASSTLGPPHGIAYFAPAVGVYSSTTCPCGPAHDVSVDLGGRVHVATGCGCLTIYEPDGTLLEINGGGQVPFIPPVHEGIDALDFRGRTWLSRGVVKRQAWYWTDYSLSSPDLTIEAGSLSNPRGVESASHTRWIVGSSGAATQSQERVYVCDRAGGEVDVFGQNTMSAPVPPGAIAWWRLEEIHPACAGESPPIRDVYGLNEGSVAAGSYPLTTKGMVRGGFDTNEGQGAIVVPDTGSIAFGTGSFSIEGWIMTRQTMNTASFLDKRQGTGKGWLLFTYQGHLGLQLNRDGTVYENYSPQVYESFVADGTWRHFAVVCERPGSGVTFYVDGVAVPGSITPLPDDVDTSNDLYIGAGNPASGDTPHSGFLDELTIYNRALMPGEVATIYGARQAGKDVPSVMKALINPLPH